MSKTISIITAGLLAIGILVTGGPVQAALNHASVATRGTTTFTGSNGDDPDATVDFVVVYVSGGISLAHLNDNVFTGADLTAALDDEADATATMSAFDTSVDMAFFYQITGTSGGETTQLFIKDFGFAPTSAGYFNDISLAITNTNTGTLTAETAGTTKDPSSWSDGVTFNSQDAVKWSGIDDLDNTEESPLLYMTFTGDGGAGTGWFATYSNKLSGQGSTRGDLPSPNPEPGSLALLGAAVAGFGGFRRFRRRRNADQEPEGDEAGDTTATPAPTV